MRQSTPGEGGRPVLPGSGPGDDPLVGETGCGGQYSFPKDGAGRRILIQGSFYPKTISPEDAEHLQEEAGRPLEIPLEGYEFNASAVLVLGR